MSEHSSLTDVEVSRLTLLTEPWMSCDDCFDQTDTAVEGLLERSTPLGDGFRVHLIGCSACYDEARALASLIAEALDVSPERAVALLDAAVITPTASESTST